MGAGSTSTLSSIAIDKSQSQRKQSANGSGHCKQDPGVTPISKNTRRDRDSSVHPSYHHGTKFSFSETPIATSSSASNYRNANNNNTVGVNGGRNASHEYRQNSFTPIPMNPSGDDIDDMHHMTLQPNLSWSLIGETSPLGEVDGIVSWSSAIPVKLKQKNKKQEEKERFKKVIFTVYFAFF